MGLFSDPNEAVRKENLKKLEDKRLRFAEACAKDGFAPQYMLLIATERGGLAGLCRDKGKICLIVGPDFGGEGEFVLERYSKLPARREEFFQAAEGMGGIFGFGKKGAVGFGIVVTLPDESEVTLEFMAGRNSYLETNLKKNPLLSLKRRRGDANIMWDMTPIERSHLSKIETSLAEHYLA